MKTSMERFIQALVPFADERVPECAADRAAVPFRPAGIDQIADPIAEAQNEQRHRVHAEPNPRVALLDALDRRGDATFTRSAIIATVSPLFFRAIAMSLPSFTRERRTAAGRVSEIRERIVAHILAPNHY